MSYKEELIMILKNQIITNIKIESVIYDCSGIPTPGALSSIFLQLYLSTPDKVRLGSFTFL